jgi:hypothetical protein
MAPIWRLLVLVIAMRACTNAAIAGPVHFEIQSQDETLNLTLRGQETLFFPKVHVLDAEGRWLRAPATDVVTQIKPDATLRARLPANLSKPLHRSAALRISFQDRAGHEFVQFGSTLPWPNTQSPAALHLRNGAMWVARPPQAATATWVLAPGDSSSDPSLLAGSAVDAAPSPATQLRWSERAKSHLAVPLATRNGPWLLIHEQAAPEGLTFRLQPVMDLTGAPVHHPSWLSASDAWATAAVGALGLSLLLSWPRQIHPARKDRSQRQAAIDQ